MADERIYEQRLTNACASALVASTNAKKFIKAAQDRLSIQASIKGRIAELIGISASDAASYIDYSTGEFKGGKYMPHCLDSQLQRLFAQLEQVTKEANKYPYHTMNEASSDSSKKLAQLQQVINEVKSVFGETKAKEIIARAKANAIKTTGIAFADNEIELEDTSSVIDLDEGKKSAFAGIGSEEQGMSM